MRSVREWSTFYVPHMLRADTNMGQQVCRPLGVCTAQPWCPCTVVKLCAADTQ
jgi:hypothetical protein